MRIPIALASEARSLRTRPCTWCADNRKRSIMDRSEAHHRAYRDCKTIPQACRAHPARSGTPIDRGSKGRRARGRVIDTLGDAMRHSRRETADESIGAHAHRLASRNDRYRSPCIAAASGCRPPRRRRRVIPGHERLSAPAAICPRDALHKAPLPVARVTAVAADASTPTDSAGGSRVAARQRSSQTRRTESSPSRQTARAPHGPARGPAATRDPR